MWLEIFCTCRVILIPINLRLVTLQSLIMDTQASLDIVAKNVDGLLVNEMFSLVRFLYFSGAILTLFQRRNISEREARIRELRNNHCIVLDRIAQRGFFHN